MASGSGLSLVLPARDTNAKYSRHFPLATGRKVAFKVPPVMDKGGEVAEEGGWILAVVKKVEKGNRCVSFSIRQYAWNWLFTTSYVE